VWITKHTTSQKVYSGFFKPVFWRAFFREPPTMLGVDNTGMNSFSQSCPLFWQRKNSKWEPASPDKVAEVYVIGDAKEPRKALEAIAEGANIGRKI